MSSMDGRGNHGEVYIRTSLYRLAFIIQAHRVFDITVNNRKYQTRKQILTSRMNQNSDYVRISSTIVEDLIGIQDI